MPTFTLFLRRSSRGSDYAGSLYLRVIHNRITKSTRLAGCRLFLHEWDDARKRIITHRVVEPLFTPDATSAEQLRTLQLQQIQQCVYNHLQLIRNFADELEKQGRYTVNDLMRAFRLKKDDGKLIGYTEMIARELERSGQERTAKAYRTVARGLIKFNKGEDIPLDQINNRLIRSFETDLKSRGKLPNTISYYMRNLRAIYNRAVAQKRVTARDEKPFAGVFVGVTKSRKRALSIGEMKTFHDIDFDSLRKEHHPQSKEYHQAESLHAAWKIFFFCFHARGMSFVDMAYLQKDNIRGGVLRYYRRKTGQLIEIKVTKVMKQIIDSFSKQVRSTPYLFPVILDMKRSAHIQYESGMRMQNMRLKKLAAMAGLIKHVSTHVARHCWATIAKEQNLPVWVISEGLGHSSEKMTYTYLAMFEQSVLDAANERISRAVSKATEKFAPPLCCRQDGLVYAGV